MSVVTATYRDGVFQPLEPVDLPDGTTVRIEIAPETAGKAWMQYAGCISSEDAAEMRTAIEKEYEQIDPNAWR